MAVWKGIWRVEFGRVISYSELAKSIERENAVRAVGGACGTYSDRRRERDRTSDIFLLVGKNPVPLIVPCHRIVGASGALTGYSASGGLEVSDSFFLLSYFVSFHISYLVFLSRQRKTYWSAKDTITDRNLWKKKKFSLWTAKQTIRENIILPRQAHRSDEVYLNLSSPHWGLGSSRLLSEAPDNEQKFRGTWYTKSVTYAHWGKSFRKQLP